ncbi:MAG: hypothetical protein AB7E30_03970 [Lawsonibacter sp.]
MRIGEARERELVKLLGTLSKERLNEVLSWIALGVKRPQFFAEFDSITPPGRECPPYEAVKALAAKWMEKAA